MLNVADKLFPDTYAARGERPEPAEQPSSEGVAFAHLMRGIHW